MKTPFQDKIDSVLKDNLPEVAKMAGRLDMIATDILVEMNNRWDAWDSRVKSEIGPTVDVNLFLASVFLNYAAGCLLLSYAAQKNGFEKADFLKMSGEQFDVVEQNLGEHKRGLS